VKHGVRGERMALGRITGPLLKANLLRQGVDLAFETNLLYLDVKNGRVGIKTALPTHDLQVAGTTRTTNLEVTTRADIATFTIQGNTISSSSSTINLDPSGADPVVYQGTIVTGNLELYDHNIATTGTNTNLTISTTGTGQVNINSNVLVNGDLHATGTITADGNIQLGDDNTDGITFNADITSNITPDVTNFYDLGAVDKTWRTVYSNNINTTNVTASSIIANGIDLILPPGKTYFVTTNGSDANAGVHENNPLASIKQALSLATAGDTVYVYPGVYYEIFPLTIPAGVSLRGASIRSVLIQPTVGTIDKDAILLNGETTVEDISLTGFRYNSANDTGYAYRFANGMTTTTRSPYIRNITVITRGVPSVSSVAGFSVQNKAAINRIKAIIPDLVTNTAITRSSGNTETQNISLTASDGTTGTALQALIDCVIYVLDNGAATASLPSIVANAGLTTTPTLLRAAAIVAANMTFLKAEMSAYINITYPGFWSSYSQTKAERDLGYILTGIQYDITHGGNERSIAQGIAYWQNPTSDPYGFDNGEAGRGAFLDGSIVNGNSKEAAGLFHSATFIVPNQTAIRAINGVRIEWLNSFSYFANKGIHLQSGSAGFAGAGVTRLRINSKTGTWNVGNTVKYYDSDGTTLLASGTIASVVGDYINLTGKCSGFETVTDRLGKPVNVNGGAKLSTAQKKYGTASIALDGTGDYLTVASTPDFGFPSTVSRIAKTITVNGNAAVSATQSKFGGSSIAFDGTGDYLSLGTSVDFGFGTGDFTIEGWFYKTAVATQYLFDTRITLNENSVAVQSQGNGTLRLFVNGAFVLTSSNAHTNNAWNHLAISRASGITRFFINGVVSTTTFADATNYGTTKPLVVGAQYNGTTAFTGYIDEFRVSNTARYTATFTPSVAAFNADSASKLLIHADSTIIDDVGGTASDFTAEAWIYPTAGSAYQTIFDFRSTAIETAIFLGINTVNQVYLYVNGAITITTSVSLMLNTWSHIALVRYNGTTKIYINGASSGSAWVDINNYGSSNPLHIGADYSGAYGFTGYIDDIRITKGLGRYTGVYFPPTSALVGDLFTVLLLNCNGANNSTAIVDNGVTLQDLRAYNGATLTGSASLINFADYGDFGAEFRSIGSACVYGTYGVYADGDGQGEGVIAYLISQNFAYVGTGKLSNNDPNDRIAANEVYHTARAKIYYTSVDNEGNFKVGDAFYVNQKTGEVLFNGQNLSITSLNGITFSDGVNTTIITAQEIDTGNIRISGNTVESIAGDVNVNAFSGNINLQNNTNISGNLITSVDLNVNGNTTLGDTSSDTINFVGGINTDIIPADTATYNLGNSITPLRWKNVYLNRAEVDGLVIDNNIISTTIGNDDLTFTANGSGRVYFPNNNVQLDQSLTVTNDLTVTTGLTSVKNIGVTGTITQTGDINQTGNFTTSGLTQVTGNITGTGYLQLPVITISGNNISTTTTDTDLQLVAYGAGNVVFEGIKVQDNNIQSTVTDSNITLTPQGTGIVTVNSTQSLQIPIGTTGDAPGTPSVGMIRYSSTNSRYEGWTGTYWQQLGGVIDVAGSTYITPELTPGSGDNTIRFYTAGAVRATLDAAKLATTTIETNNIRVTGNTISTVVGGTDINLTTSGVGGVRLGNLQIKNNTITNVVAGAITEFIETSGGYVRIGGRGGVVIPSGDTANDRPGLVETGMMRFNTVLQLVEIYNGVTWTSVAGSSGGITAAEATDLGIVTALLFG